MASDDADLQAIWRSQEPTLRVTLEDLQRREAKLARHVRVRNGMEYAASALVVFVFGRMLWSMPSSRGTVPVRLAIFAIFVALGYVVLQLKRHGTALPPPPSGASLADYRAHHRASLVRQRDLLRSAWRWYVAPLFAATLLFYVAVAMTVGPVLARPRVALLFAGLLAGTAAFYALIGWANVRVARRIQVDITNLDD
jgi:hypothetical protein